jgi:hypothetical protein
MVRNYCKDLCRFVGIKKAPPGLGSRVSLYYKGYKYCRRCERFFKHNPEKDTIFCKCCGNCMRSTGCGSKRWQRQRDITVHRY